ncbi:neurofilament heavy polypeptide [Anabrus simplex]|uniref:neurofilament heavy polypeptide n=1 Tax=Anabrus simplex TaxID=316456 RepID=UPI0035A369D3
MKNSPKAAKGSAAAKKKAATKASPKNILKHFPGATDVKLRKVGNKRVAAVKTTPTKPPAKGRKAKTPVKSPPKKRELEEANSIEQHIEAEEVATTSKSPARRGRGQAKSPVGVKTEPPKTPTKSPGKKGKTKGKSGAVNSSEDVVDNEEVVNGEEAKTPSKASPRGKKGAAKSSPKQKKGRPANSRSNEEPKTPEKTSPRKRKSESGNQSTGDDVDGGEEAGTPSTKRRRLDVKSSANVNSNDQVVNGEEPQTRGRKAVGKGRGAKNAPKSPAAKSPRGKKTENEIAASLPETEGGRTPRKGSAKSSSGSPKALKKKPARKVGRPAKSMKSKSPKKSRASRK